MRSAGRHNRPQRGAVVRRAALAGREVLRTLGGSGTISEINERVVDQGGFMPEQQQVLHGNGPRTEIEYRLAWARTYVKRMGLADNSARGVWTLTERGRTVSEGEIKDLHVESRRQRYAWRVAGRRAARPNEPEVDSGKDGANAPDDPAALKECLLDVVMSLSPGAFERLTQRLLREAGFISVNVTGAGGDGGIDGLGVYRLSLVSFPMYFQCKRYRGNVPSSVVRDFRGAMAGRGDRGLIITTGTFSAEAKKEATRDGVPPVDLIDGDRLCELLKEYRIGVTTEVVQVERVTEVIRKRCSAVGL